LQLGGATAEKSKCPPSRPVSAAGYVGHMARTPRYKKGAVFDGWELGENLGVGGNGEAWRARNEQGAVRVVKLLYPGAERYDRFKREIAAVNELVPAGFPALPIEYVHLPDRPSRQDPPFYVMPEAIPIAKALSGKGVREKVGAVREFAEALATLLSEHGRNHRDVKPPNMYEYEGRFVLGDFGLVTDPDPQADALTADGKAVGPWAFLPSEVFNPPPGMEIDWQKVDVYCLAMSLWCLVRESDDPPRRIEPNGVMSLTRQLAVPPPVTDPTAVEDPGAVEYRTHIRELDAILAASTADDPDKRPALARFAQQLGDWEEGIRVRTDMYRYIVDSEADEEAVLGWLVSTTRYDPLLGLNVYEVRDRAEVSPLAGMNAGRFGDALDGLVESYRAVGERFPERGEAWHWSKVYPTSYGIDQVEPERVEVETLPLLRTLVKDGPVDVMDITGSNPAVTFGASVMPGPELYYLLRYLREAGLVDFEEQWESGPGVLVMHLKATRIGRMRVVSQ
jgi:hypothetical protein